MYGSYYVRRTNAIEKCAQAAHDKGFAIFAIQVNLFLSKTKPIYAYQQLQNIGALVNCYKFVDACYANIEVMSNVERLLLLNYRSGGDFYCNSSVYFNLFLR